MSEKTQKTEKTKKTVKASVKASAKTASQTPVRPIDIILRKAPPDDVKEIIAQNVVANGTIAMGGKKFAQVAPEILCIPPEYQRLSNLNQAVKIAKEWSARQYTPPKVSYRDKKLMAIDGQHTAMAAILAGVDNIAIDLIEGITAYEEAKLFDTQDDNKVRVNWYSKYRSMLFRREPIAVALDDLCTKYSLHIGPAGKNTPKRRMSAISCAIRMLRDEQYGKDFLDWCFGIMDKTNLWLLSGTSGANDCHINMMTDTYIEGKRENCLDLYASRLVAAMDQLHPNEFDTVANNTYGYHDRRTPTKRLCLDIAHGMYVPPQSGYVKRPVALTPED